MYRDEELEKFDDAMKPTVARKIGESNMDKVSKDEMQRLTQFALKYVVSHGIVLTCVWYENK